MKMTETQLEDARAALNEVLEAVENNAKIARECGVKPQAVTGWLERGMCPPDAVATLCELAESKGRVIAPWRLRPDVFSPAMFAKYAAAAVA